MKEPFSELEELVIISIYSPSKHLIFPGPLRWSSHIRILHLRRTFLPSLPALLFSSANLEELLLDDLPNWILSPGTLVITLSGMSQLESLSLYYFSTSFLRTLIGISLPSGGLFSQLSPSFDFRGISEYLGDLVAGIDAPCLGKIATSLSNSQADSLSQLGQFINRIEFHRSHTRAEIQISDSTIQYTLSILQSPSQFVLRMSCFGLYNQLSTVTDIFNLFLFGVGDIGVVTRPLSWRPVALDGEHWLRPLRPFSDAARFHVADEFANPIMRALQQAEGELESVLPALCELYIEIEPEPHCDWVLLWITMRSFTARTSSLAVPPTYGMVKLHASTSGKWGNNRRREGGRSNIVVRRSKCLRSPHVYV